MHNYDKQRCLTGLLFNSGAKGKGKFNTRNCVKGCRSICYAYTYNRICYFGLFPYEFKMNSFRKVARKMLFCGKYIFVGFGFACVVHIHKVV